MEAAVQISLLLLLFSSCKAGIIPYYSSYYPTSTQQYFQYPEYQETYMPYYYSYQNNYPDLRSYPSTYYQNTLPVYSYSGFPMTYGYYPIPLYDFQINILRVVPDVKNTHPTQPKPSTRPDFFTTTANPRRTTTETDQSDVDEFIEDNIETLDTKIVPQTKSSEVINTSEEIESITEEIENTMSRT